MFLNYLKLSIRLLARNPFFTFINVAGLSVGFAVFFILWPFTQAELASDQFIKDYERIARPIADFRWTDNGGESWGHLNIAVTASHAANELRAHAAVEDVTRFLSQEGFFEESTPDLNSDLIATIEKAGQPFALVKLENSICADTNFFEFFGLPFIHGDKKSALSHSDAVVLSLERSKEFFGGENPVGKFLRINGKAFQVTGVFKDLPHHSHLQFDVVFSNINKLAFWNEMGEFWVIQYFKMKGNPAQLADLYNENKEKLIGSFLKKNPHIKIDYTYQPLAEIAFSQGYTGDTFKPKSKFMLHALAGVSVVVLIMAWMNYVNLTVSRTKTRFKEIAARKVSGALLQDLFFQFICQSAVMNALAALIGITMIQAVRLPFDQLLNIRIVSFYDLPTQTLLFFLLVFTIGIVITAGYPASVTLRYSARQLLTKDIPAGKRVLTSIFTTTQYAAALALVAWIFVMSSQLDFILNRDLGIDKENIVVFESPVLGMESDGRQKLSEFVSVVKGKLGVDEITMSARVCGEEPWSIDLRRVGSDIFYGIDSHGGVDENFIPAFNLKLVTGRNFLKDEVNLSAIISRFTSERLGFKSPDEAIGATLEVNAGTWKNIEVIGVIEDYRVTPFLLKEGSTESATGRGQVLIGLNSDMTRYVPERISFKLNSPDFQNSVAEIERIYNQLFPGNIFKWYFLNDNIGQQYGDQKISRNQITFFTVLAVSVACLGLLGMISNKVAEKMKEVSVRRILGAGNRHIMTLLLSSTGAQIGFAMVVGIPIAWSISQQYLEKYTEHITLQWWHFGLPILILVLIMFCTIASVLWKTAKSNPVEALRTE